MRKFLATAAIAASLAIAPMANALIIDPFDTAQTASIGVVGTDLNTLGAVPNGSPFDDRDLFVNLVSSSGDPSSTQDNGTGTLNLNSGPATTTQWYVEWTSGAGVDLTNGVGDDRVQVNFLQSNSSSATWAITANDGSTSATVSGGTIGAGAPPSGNPLSVLFSSFGGVDFSNIQTLRFSVDGTADTLGKDIIVDFLETSHIPPASAPTPGSLLLLGSGLLGLGRMYRLRRRSA